MEMKKKKNTAGMTDDAGEAGVLCQSRWIDVQAYQIPKYARCLAKVPGMMKVIAPIPKQGNILPHQRVVNESYLAIAH